jgi:predicted amidohydrolase YtcJ
MKARLILVATAIFLFACESDDPEPSQQSRSVEPKAAVVAADRIYTNARVYTVNKAQPWAEAVAVKDGKIMAVGSSADVQSMAGDRTDVVDLEGRLAMPGLIDAHIHLGGFYMADKLEGKLLRFPGGSSKAEMRSLLAEYAENNPDLKVIVAENYNSGLFEGGSPPKEFFDEVVPDRPVIAMSDTEHEALLNSMALARAGITSETPDPPNGMIIRNPETGEPAGTLKEAAAGRWGWSEYPAPTHEDHVDGVEALLSFLNSVGLTSLKFQHADPVEIAALREVDQSGKLTARTAISWTWLSPLNPKSREKLEETIANRSQVASERIRTDFVKINIDGTPTGSAFMLEPYLGGEDGGAPFIGLEELTEAVAYFDSQDIGVTFHVMGDAGMRLVVDAMAATAKRNGGLNARHQLGHASLIEQGDMQRIVELDLTAEFSAPDIHYDVGIVDAVDAAIGPDRFAGWFPVKQFIQAGGRAVIASDGPLFWLDPLVAIQKMVLRPYPGGENLTLEEVIASMTINAAYVLNDDMVGSLEVGKWADLIVLDQDIFSIPKDEIGRTNVMLTIVGGETVFDALTDPSSEEAIEDLYDVELNTEADSLKSMSFGSAAERP